MTVFRKNLLLSAIMFVLSMLMLIPFVMMVITSLKTMAEVTSPTFIWFPASMMFENYLTVFTRGNWVVYFGNSLFITIITVIGSLIINSLAGYSFARLTFRGRDFLFMTSLIALMVPQQVTMVPVFIIMKMIPFAGGNDAFGQGGIGWINSYPGLIVPILAGAFGSFLCRQFFLNFPQALDDAAKIDGCTRFGAYLRIYLPLAKPILATLAALKFTYTWNDYLWPLIMVNDDKYKTVQLALAVFRNEFGVEWNLLMAATTMIVLPIIAVFLLAQRYFIQSIATTGLK